MGVDDDQEVERLVGQIRDQLAPHLEPIDQTVEPVMICLPDGTPVIECTSQTKGAFREVPILYCDGDTPLHRDIVRRLRQENLPLIVLTSVEEVRDELKGRGMSDREIQEKLTGITHSMRSDVGPMSLAEVESAMPAIYPTNPPGNTSRRPALPKNRKRDRWN